MIGGRAQILEDDGTATPTIADNGFVSIKTPDQNFNLHCSQHLGQHHIQLSKTPKKNQEVQLDESKKSPSKFETPESAKSCFSDSNLNASYYSSLPSAACSVHNLEVSGSDLPPGSLNLAKYKNNNSLNKACIEQENFCNSVKFALQMHSDNDRQEKGATPASVAASPFLQKMIEGVSPSEQGDIESSMSTTPRSSLQQQIKKDNVFEKPVRSENVVVNAKVKSNVQRKQSQKDSKVAIADVFKMEFAAINGYKAVTADFFEKNGHQYELQRCLSNKACTQAKEAFLKTQKSDFVESKITPAAGIPTNTPTGKQLPNASYICKSPKISPKISNSLLLRNEQSSASAMSAEKSLSPRSKVAAKRIISPTLPPDGGSLAAFRPGLRAQSLTMSSSSLSFMGRVSASNIRSQKAGIAAGSTSISLPALPTPRKVVVNDACKNITPNGARSQIMVGISPNFTIKGEPNACLFVASLNAQKSDEHLTESVTKHFLAWGQLMNVKVMKDWMNRPYAFVQYSDVNDAKRALAQAHDNILDGRRIRVEQARVNRTLLITRLPKSMTERALQNCLEKWGKIEEVNFFYHQGTGKSRCCACAKFCYREDAIRAFLNIRQLGKWAVEWAANIEKQVECEKVCIFVANLNPKKVTHELLQARFSRYGSIDDLQLFNKENEAFAFIRYKVEENATEAIAKEHDSIFLEDKIRVQYRENKLSSPTQKPAQVHPPLQNVSGAMVCEPSAKDRVPIAPYRTLGMFHGSSTGLLRDEHLRVKEESGECDRVSQMGNKASSQMQLPFPEKAMLRSSTGMSLPGNAQISGGGGMVSACELPPEYFTHSQANRVSTAAAAAALQYVKGHWGSGTPVTLQHVSGMPVHAARPQQPMFQGNVPNYGTHYASEFFCPSHVPQQHLQQQLHHQHAQRQAAYSRYLDYAAVNSRYQGNDAFFAANANLQSLNPNERNFQQFFQNAPVSPQAYVHPSHAASQAMMLPDYGSFTQQNKMPGTPFQYSEAIDTNNTGSQRTNFFSRRDDSRAVGSEMIANQTLARGDAGQQAQRPYGASSANTHVQRYSQLRRDINFQLNVHSKPQETSSECYQQPDTCYMPDAALVNSYPRTAGLVDTMEVAPAFIESKNAEPVAMQVNGIDESRGLPVVNQFPAGPSKHVNVTQSNGRVISPILAQKIPSNEPSKNYIATTNSFAAAPSRPICIKGSDGREISPVRVQKALGNDTIKASVKTMPPFAAGQSKPICIKGSDGREISPSAMIKKHKEIVITRRDGPADTQGARVKFAEPIVQRQAQGLVSVSASPHDASKV